MRTKLLLATAAAALLVGMVPSPASAQDVTTMDGTVTANLSSSGTRSITAVNPITTTASLGALASGSYGVTVAEVARTGTANWSVTAKLCGQTALAKDCTLTKNNALSSSTSTAILGGSAVELSSRAVSQTGTSAVAATAPTGAATLGSAATLFTTAGQSTGTLYTETYTSSGSVKITPPANQPAETYVGYFVVTLV